ncbi:MAG TPA: methyl-accepting chemotaxis protein [Nitrospirae bacterium]|nr:methyl-accepting chemotaxis protein [Nitrospirota bacterium]
MKRTWRRRNYFIKKDLQGKYVFMFFIFVVLGSILFTVLFALLSSHTLTVVYERNNLRIGLTPMILLKEIIRAYWLFIISGGLLVALTAVFVTHRFAGPVYRFEKTLEDLIEGRLNFQIRLRKRDEAKELAERFNKMINLYSTRLKEIRELADKIKRELNTLQKGDVITLSGDALDSLLRTVNELRMKLDYFKTDHE